MRTDIQWKFMIILKVLKLSNSYGEFEVTELNILIPNFYGQEDLLASF